MIINIVLMMVLLVVNNVIEYNIAKNRFAYKNQNLILKDV